MFHILCHSDPQKFTLSSNFTAWICHKNIYFLLKIGLLYFLWRILAKIVVYFFWLVSNVSFHFIYRLSLDKNVHSTMIDWLELVEAVQKQSCK